MSWRASEAEIVWHEEPPAGVVERVRADLEDSLGKLKSAERLISHIVFLSDNYDEGPAVLVYGQEGSDALYCEYVENLEWAPISEVPFQ